MPCYDGRDDNNNHYLCGQITKLEKDKDQLTRMLCSVCKIVELTHDDDSALPHNAKIWWSEHKEADAIREKKARQAAAKKRKAREEKIRKMEIAETALAKLSSEEIEALGL